MKTIDLSKKWKFRILGENVYGITNEFMETNVPSSIYASLLELGLIPDPYYRDNELTALKLMENEFEYDKCFLITREYMEQGDVEVCFEGIDTLADVFLNGHFLGKTNNMHRSWSFDITEYAVVGENRLTVKLHSPTT